MTKKHNLLTVNFLDFPVWVRDMSPERRKVLAAVGRLRLAHSNPIAAPIAAKMADDVAIANLLFRVDDKAAIEMLMDAYLVLQELSTVEGIVNDAVESR